MIHHIKVTPEVAHLLTKISKKQKWYFRTLTRTDHTEEVEAEIQEKGVEYLNNNNIHYSKTK